MIIIMSNVDKLEIYPFIKFIWEPHHHLALVAIVRLIHYYVNFAAKLLRGERV